MVLCKAIFTQQISTAIATILFGRFRELFPQPPDPGTRAGGAGGGREEDFRGCGLSRQKRPTCSDLARHFEDGVIPARQLGRMGDEEVIEWLGARQRDGRWTAEMFLIFTLNRPDVLPVDDLGLRKGVRAFYNLPERPSPISSSSWPSRGGRIAASRRGTSGGVGRGRTTANAQGLAAGRKHEIRSTKSETIPNRKRRNTETAARIIAGPPFLNFLISLSELVSGFVLRFPAGGLRISRASRLYGLFSRTCAASRS